MNSQIKLAAGDQEFETGFFQLAYDKLQSKLYNLLPFLVGFQLVKKNDDGTKAVGVFGFKADNGQVLFVPTFFINGKIKEMDILYSKNNNQFFPLTEDFAELFLKDDVTGLGSPAHEKKVDIMKSTGNPNYRDVIWPPRTGRIAYAEAKDLEEKNPEVFEKAAEQLTSTKNYPEYQTSLTAFVKASDVTVKQAFWDLMEKDSAFVDAVRSMYSDEEIADSLRVEKQAKEAKKNKVKVVQFNDTAEAKNLPEPEKKKVLNKGYTIIDDRRHEDVSHAGVFKFTETFTNPSKSGFYPYVTDIGTIRHGLILLQLQNLRPAYSTDDCIVIDLESKNQGQAYEQPVRKVFIKDQIDIADISAIMSKLEEPSESLPSYSTWILINEKMHATEPFRIIENYKDSSGVRRIVVEPEWCPAPRPNQSQQKPMSTGLQSNADNDRNGHPGRATLVLTKRVGDKIEHRNKAVYVPKGFKMMQLHFSNSYYGSVDYSLPKDQIKKLEDEVALEKTRIREGKPGGLYCLDGFLRENNTFPFTLHSNGSQYFLDIGGAKIKYETPLEAKIAMVTDAGLNEKTAEELMTGLLPNRQRKGYIKLAVTGDSTLSLVDEEPTSNEFGQPTYYGVPWMDMHDRSDGYTGDPTAQGLGVKPDLDTVSNTIGKATQMAQSGQKEIFDTQTIGALSKYTDTSTKVLEYVPNLVDSLDKLGRMLFLAYWDTDKFEKMYGKDELPELVELVKNVFTNLGDLVIFMKRKVPEISINTSEQEQDE